GRRLIPRLLTNQLNLHRSQNITNQQWHRIFVASAAVSTKVSTNVFPIYCRGLPLSAKENEVSEFLGGKGIKAVELWSTTFGEALVECEDEE
ncbi:hypothetical protein PMAYCL1PPCAC_13914, partial [Pristionchus mayeri]